MGGWCATLAVSSQGLGVALGGWVGTVSEPSRTFALCAVNQPDNGFIIFTQRKTEMAGFGRAHNIAVLHMQNVFVCFDQF